MRLRIVLTGIGMLALGLASAEDKPKGYQNLTGSGFLHDKVEYKTYDELLYPLKFNSFTNKFAMKEDENNPVMIYECPFRTAFPDSFSVELITGTNVAREYRFRKSK